MLDRAAGLLRRDGEPVGLGQRGVALLDALLGADGQTVTKDELLACALPGLIVEEANLSDRGLAQDARQSAAPFASVRQAHSPKRDCRYQRDSGR